MNITVYLGSAHGNDPKYKNEVVRLGNWIGKAGHRLIYGGSRIGLMGELAEAVLTAGGEVIGVEPDFFVDSCLQHHGITRLIVTKTMAERKARMIELGDVFIAFPGGTGTLEEISEVMSQVRLGHNERPCIVLNLDEPEEKCVGFFPCTGMHGGKMFLRSACRDIEFPEQVTARPASPEDLAELRGYLEAYCGLFGLDLEAILNADFTVVTPDSKNPYRQMYVAN